MYHLSKFIHSSQGRYLMSILIGIGIASLFHVKCASGQCQVVQAPPLADVASKTYKYGDVCYQFAPTPNSCADAAVVAVNQVPHISAGVSLYKP